LQLLHLLLNKISMTKIKNKDIDKIFYENIFNFKSKNDLNENLTQSDKSEISSIVKREIKDFLNLTRNIDFEKKVFDIVKDRIKSDKDIEKYVLEISRNVLVQLYKSLWLKKSFWVNDIKNSST
jgi:hypothetical protein